MSNPKDVVNKGAGILLIVLAVIIISGYLLNIDSIFGISSFYLFYIAGPVFLIWFGTRRNSCGSCNQDYSTSKTKSENYKTN